MSRLLGGCADSVCGTASFQITDRELLVKLQRSFGIQVKGLMLDGAGGVAPTVY